MAVITRLDRAAQYSRASMTDREALGYWATRYTGWRATPTRWRVVTAYKGIAHCAPAGSSNRGGDGFQPDDAGERTDFALLILTQLEQQRHRRRLQLLDFGAVGINGRASRVRLGLTLFVDL